MAYEKTIWVNDDEPFIEADNLNKIENELELLDTSKSDLLNAINNPTYTTTEGTDLLIDNTRVGKMKFEYYGATEQDGNPTPDNPVEVKTVTGENLITIENEDGTQSQSYEINLGKNLFEFTGETHGTNVTTQIIDKKLTMTWTDGFNVDLVKEVTNLDANKTYTISFLHKGNALYVRNPNASNTNIVETQADTTYQKYTYTFTGTSSFKFRFLRKDTTGTAEIKNIQLEKGSQATSYAPYFEPIQLCKIGNYQDYIHDNGGKWFKHKEVGKTIDSSGSTGITINEMVNNGSIFSYCGGTVNAKTITYASAISATNYIYYQLATPIEEEITEPTLINQLNAIKYGAESYYSQTNIIITSEELQPILKVQTMDKIV